MPNRDSENESFGGRRSEAERDAYSDEISLKPLFRTLWSYRRVIAASVSAALIVFVVWALGAYVLQPTERQASLEFRLLFEGADRNEYPNRLRFSRSEIIAPPVLTEVFSTVNLERYLGYEEFKNAVFVLESSKDVELLALEYQGKLADTRLSAVDRGKLEEEFRQKREALRVPQYTLNFMSPGNGTRVPAPLMSKVLNDILATWADQAAKRKGALDYQVDVLSPNVLREELITAEDYVVRLDLLRAKINRILGNLEQLSKLPGAGVVRVGENRVSLPEVRANLEDLLRFRLQPLLGAVRARGHAREDRERLMRYLEDRLFQVRLDREEAASRVNVLQEALRTYILEGSAVALTGGQEGSSAGAGGVGAAATQTIIPQVSDSFLDRIVAMATRTRDVEYRQRFADQIIGAGQERARLERETGYYQEMLDWARRLTAGSTAQADGSDAKTIDSRFDELHSGVVRALEQANLVYTAVSAQNLNPRTLLYTITGPFSVTTQRSLTLRTLALYGLLVLLVSVMLSPLACLIHHYFEREIRPAPSGPGPSARQADEAAVDRTVGV